VAESGGESEKECVKGASLRAERGDGLSRSVAQSGIDEGQALFDDVEAVT
jgi:hypothetical protein